MYKKILILIISIICLSCKFDQNGDECNSSVNISNLSFNVQNDNLLRYDINYQLFDTVQSFIKFWKANNPDKAEFI